MALTEADLQRHQQSIMHTAPPPSALLLEAYPQSCGGGRRSVAAITALRAMVIDSPHEADVLCGKDKTFGKHPGNQIYRKLIAERAADYALATSKRSKMEISKSIITTMQHKHGSRFLRQAATSTTSGKSKTKSAAAQEGWVELSSQQARDKATHALRFWNDHKAAKTASGSEGGGGGVSADNDDASSSAAASRSKSPGFGFPNTAGDGGMFATTAVPSSYQDAVAAAANAQQHQPYHHSVYPYSSAASTDQQQQQQYYHHQQQRTDAVDSNPFLHSQHSYQHFDTAEYSAALSAMANDDDESSHDASSSFESNSYTESETDTAAAAERLQAQRHEQFVYASMRQDHPSFTTHHHPYPPPASQYDDADAQQQQQSLPRRRRHAEGGGGDGPSARRYGSGGLDEDDTTLSSGARPNSLYLLSTIRSLSLVDYLEGGGGDGHGHDGNNESADAATLRLGNVNETFDTSTTPLTVDYLPDHLLLLDDHVEDHEPTSSLPPPTSHHESNKGGRTATSSNKGDDALRTASGGGGSALAMRANSSTTAATDPDKETFDTLRSDDFAALLDTVGAGSSGSLPNIDWVNNETAGATTAPSAAATGESNAASEPEQQQRAN